MQDIFVAKIAKVIPVPIDLILVGIYLHFYFFDLIACIYIYIYKESVSFKKKGGKREKKPRYYTTYREGREGILKTVENTMFASWRLAA
jgi:hypothetical protein